MITDEQKEEVKKLARKKRFINKKDKYIKYVLDSVLLDDFDNDFNANKYENIKKYTEEQEY